MTAARKLGIVAGAVFVTCTLSACSGQFRTGDAVYTRNEYLFGAFGTTYHIGFPTVSLSADGDYEFAFKRAPAEPLTFELSIEGTDPQAFLEAAGTVVAYQLYRGPTLVAEASGSLHEWRRSEESGRRDTGLNRQWISRAQAITASCFGSAWHTLQRAR